MALRDDGRRDGGLNGERGLDELFRAYREACQFGDAGPDFMPQIWRRIEARQAGAIFGRRTARVFVTATVALAVVSGVVVLKAPQRPLEDTWVEAIANNSIAQNVSFYEPVRLAPAGR